MFKRTLLIGHYDSFSGSNAMFFNILAFRLYSQISHGRSARWPERFDFGVFSSVVWLCACPLFLLTEYYLPYCRELSAMSLVFQESLLWILHSRFCKSLPFLESRFSLFCLFLSHFSKAWGDWKSCIPSPFLLPFFFCFLTWGLVKRMARWQVLFHSRN